MYFKNIFHKFGKISIFMKFISLARATVFLKAFQNTERPRRDIPFAVGVRGFFTNSQVNLV